MRKSKIVFSKIFQSPDFQVGDYVVFPHGKIVWKICSISSHHKPLYYRLRSLSEWGTNKYVWDRESKNLIKVSKEEAIRILALSYPRKLGYYFREDDLLEFFKANLRR